MALIVRDYDPNDSLDAERVAAMFNDFDSAWPGGFTRGAPETPEGIRQRMARLRRLAILVADWDGELVGYCDLEAQEGQKEFAYVDLLGARASVHGKGVGKMLLREIVRRATDLGYRQVTLHTWAGNTKAVPLYKKIGFHWEPETTVYMRNFMPTALTIAAGRQFFAGRDWYECHVRDIVIAPDDVTWKGMKVYPYRFRDGDRFLNLYFGAQGERLTGIETPEYSLACIIPVEDAPAGETAPITWEIAPGDGKPLEVALLTEADPGLEIAVQERFTVTAPMTLTRELRIAPDARPRPWREPAHRVRSTLLVNGTPVVLETGVKVVYPIDIEYDGQGLFPGRPERIEVRLRSNVDRPLSGQLALEAHPAIGCEPATQAFTLEPRLMTQCAFTITGREAGVFPLALRYEAGAVRGGRPVTFRVFAGQEALASIDPVHDETAVLESPSLRLTVAMRWGNLNLHHPTRGGHLLNQQIAELGPPFVDGRLRAPLYSVRIAAAPSGPRLVLTAPSQEMPGLTVERAVSLLAGDAVRVDYRILNTTDEALPAQLRVRTGPSQQGWLVAPTRDGLLREPLKGWGEYPQGETDVLALGATLAESWMACEDEGLFSGMLWHPGPQEDLRWSRLPNLLWDLGILPPHSSRELSPLYLVAGSGDWRQVRGWWRRLIQPSGTVHEEATPKPARVLEVRCEPSPALLRHDVEETSIALFSRRGKALTGALTLSGTAFTAQPAEFTLPATDRDRPFAAPMRIVSPAAPEAGFLEARVETGPLTERFRLPVVRLGAEGDVRLSEGDNGAFSVDNGLLTLRVAPRFLGSLYALERDGVNHLLSAYPESRPFVFTNPWYGGVHPFIGWMGDPRLTRETFTGGPAERVGERGLRWTGVRAVCEPQHKDLRWLRLEVEYLTTPGSNVVALVSRWTNRSSARMHSPGDLGMAAWPQIGGTREHTLLHWQRHEEARTRRRSDFSAEGVSEKGVAVENAQTGDMLILVATGRRSYAYYEDFGAEGAHLMALLPLTFAPGETKETLFWLALCRDREQLAAYRQALSSLERLP
jgi:ribosomal protein S18 acetylase RimI-like enzyme